MLFNSFVFLFAFLPSIFAVWTLLCRLGKTKAALDWLILASLFFYGWRHPPYLVWLAASILANWALQRTILDCAAAGKEGEGKRWLVFGIVLNLASLALFKYANFVLENVNLALHARIPALELLVPLGISFFTLKQIALLVDTWRGRVGRLSPRGFLLFETFFPQLVAGPIARASQLAPQFERGSLFAFSWRNVYLGLVLFAIGMFKKVAIADRLAPRVANVFDNLGVGTVECLDAWSGAVGWTFQIYFDFSGYCDMALGLALLFNVRLPLNFNSPYKAASFREFWHRWHMTLARFCRDCLYLPPGGGDMGSVRQYAALFATMLVLGLWHGAGWTFVLFGALHGLFLCVHRLWASLSPLRLPRPLGVALTFACLVLAWGIYRAGTLPKALLLVETMFSPEGLFGLELADEEVWDFFAGLPWGLFACAAICFCLPNSMRVARTLRDVLEKQALGERRAGQAGEAIDEGIGEGSSRGRGREMALAPRLAHVLVSLGAGGLLAATFLFLNAVSDFLY